MVRCSGYSECGLGVSDGQVFAGSEAGRLEGFRSSNVEQSGLLTKWML